MLSECFTTWSFFGKTRQTFQAPSKVGIESRKENCLGMLRWLTGRTGVRVLLWFEFPAGAKIDRTDIQ